jgi:NADH-quinone oxidoreductase subunit G
LKKTLGIDVSDACGANIRIDARGREVLRFLPRNNDDVNEEWLSDKGRYQADGLTKRRLDRPWIRRDGKLVAASWEEVLPAVASINPGSSIAAIAGDLVDVETMFAAKKLLAELGSHLLEGRQTGLAYAADNLAAVNFNTTFSGIETADAILIVGSQIRNEAPLLNVRLRKAAKKGAQVFIIGPQWDPTYKAEFLGTDAAILNKLPPCVGCAGLGQTSRDHRGRRWSGQGRAGTCSGDQQSAWLRPYAGRRHGMERLQRSAHGRQPHGRSDAGLRAEGRYRRSGRRRAEAGLLAGRR